MEKKINIVELLKDCPSGMELDCMIYDNLYFDHIRENPIYPIICYTVDSEGRKNETSFNWFGKHTPIETAKCVIFPKGKTTWEGFVPPCKFKDGDVVVAEDGESFQLFLLKRFTWCSVNSYNGDCYFGWDFSCDGFRLFEEGIWGFNRLATEEEKQKLFDTIKENGYKWNPETKTLEKLPKFKIGDWVTDGISKCQVHFIDDTHYWYSENCILGNIESVDKQYHLWTIQDAKDGDVLAFNDETIVIFKDLYNKTSFHSYCHVEDGIFTISKEDMPDWWEGEGFYPATKEQCNILFQKIKESGYEWKSEIKTLEKMVKPKFKVGDRIKNKTDIWLANRTIKSYDKNIGYFTTINDWVRIEDQDNWELVPNKFDINTLVPFKSEVLVRNSDSGFWKPAFWGTYEAEKSNEHQYRNYLTTEGFVRHCIPYNDETKHLIGKTSDCPEYYKTWEE